MAVRVASLSEIASRYQAIVLDQWGVLHDGTAPYPGAQPALAQLRDDGVRLAVLSNSGKRAVLNRVRIEKMGFASGLFDLVMTSGEALWRDIHEGTVAERTFYAIEGAPGDAQVWSVGLEISLVSDVSNADAVLLMGLPDTGPNQAQAVLDAALACGLPVYCTNPDRASPRAGGVTVPSPGAFAHAYAGAGGQVRCYGKPHLPVFRAVEAALGVAPDRLLMVGDSLEHDIAGAATAGWASVFVEGGLHCNAFALSDDRCATLHTLCREKNCAPPDFTLPTLR